MFLRSSSYSSKPAEPRFRADLAALGFELNDDKFVQAGSNGRLFSTFHTDNERVNLLRKEAMRDCARAAVLDRAKGFGLAEMYLVGNTISADKPDGPHVTILSTEVSELKKRKHVLVVVGEHSQDLGIWAWRMVLGHEGIMEGSAAGLAAAVQALGQAQRSDPEEGLDHSADPFIKYPWHAEGDPTMGIIILNAGQLLYSPLHNRCMTHSSWQARTRATAMVDEFAVDQEYNRVPGHISPEQHIRTFFDSILKQMVHQDVHLYVVGIADGGDHVLEYLNTEYTLTTQPPVYHMLDSLALIEPTFKPEDVVSDAFRIFLGTRWARGWSISDKPKGTLVNTPAPFPPRVLHKHTSAMSATNEYPGTPEDGGHTQTAESESASVSTSPTATPAYPDGHATTAAETPSTRTRTSSPTEDLDEDSRTSDNDFDNGDDEGAGFNYAGQHTVCSMFSGGDVDILETLWPAVMGDVLDWLFECQQETIDLESRMHANPVPPPYRVVDEPQPEASAAAADEGAEEMDEDSDGDGDSNATAIYDEASDNESINGIESTLDDGPAYSDNDSAYDDKISPSEDITRDDELDPNDEATPGHESNADDELIQSYARTASAESLLSCLSWDSNLSSLTELLYGID